MNSEIIQLLRSSAVAILLTLSACGGSDSDSTDASDADAGNTDIGDTDTVDSDNEDTNQVTEGDTADDTTDSTDTVNDTAIFADVLSTYGIYQGDPAELTPSADYHLYELSSVLFTDYAEKQRLIKMPTGSVMVKTDDGLPEMPDGTIIAKTFYYHNEVTASAETRDLIETRLLIKSNDSWMASSYVWNEDLTEAYLSENGETQSINFVDSDGVSQTVDYEVPSQEDCVVCHQNTDVSTPIGPSMANMNFTVTRNNVAVNQLDYLHTIGILDDANASSGASVPNYYDETESLADRARAYLDINCAHCHRPEGFAGDEGIDFRFTASLADTTLVNNRPITRLLESGEMPQIGATLIDTYGVNLVLDYIESIR